MLSNEVHVQVVLRAKELAARVAAPRLRVVLALDALVRVALEALQRFLNAARGASVALYATQGPVSRCPACLFPLTVGKFIPVEALAADCTCLPCPALCALNRPLYEILWHFEDTVARASVAGLASQEPIAGIC